MVITAEGVLVGLLLGAVLGGVGAAAVVTRLAAARRATAVSEAVRRAGSEVAAARAELDAERRGARERERTLAERDDELRASFRALSADALEANGERFARLAESRLREVTATVQASTREEDVARAHALTAMLDPVAATLTRVEGQLRSAEQEREVAFAALREQVGAVAAGAQGVAGETRALTAALRAPHVRGRWGEMQLERVVDLAGMVEHCDFSRQAHLGAADDTALRPDLVVHLSGGRQVVVDAKVPFAAYLASTEAGDEAGRRERLAAHARQVRAHVDALAGKAYWRRLETTPEFVVLFVPGEVFLSAALEAEPGLLEHAFERQVVIATPTTLIALLRTVAHAWRQEALAENTARIHALGRELHGRLASLSGHLGRVGRSLDGTVKAYNEVVGSLESRVLVSARRFTDLDVTGDRLPSPSTVDRRPRSPGAPELLDDPELPDDPGLTGRGPGRSPSPPVPVGPVARGSQGRGIP